MRCVALRCVALRCVALRDFFPLNFIMLHDGAHSYIIHILLIVQVHPSLSLSSAEALLPRLSTNLVVQDVASPPFEDVMNLMLLCKSLSQSFSKVISKSCSFRYSGREEWRAGKRIKKPISNLCKNKTT